MKIAFLIGLVLIASSAISAQVNMQCPKIAITGPDRIIAPGDTMVFKASIDNAATLDLKFGWTVSAGLIESGQGTSSITVRVPSDLYNYKLIATVTVEPFFGCNEGLNAEAIAETAQFVCGLAPDDFPKLNRNDERARLLNAAYLWSQDRQDLLVLVVFVATDESEVSARRRAAFIREFFRKDRALKSNGLHVPADHLSIVFGDAVQTHTAVYLIPPSGLASFIKSFSSARKIEN